MRTAGGSLGVQLGSGPVSQQGQVRTAGGSLGVQLGPGPVSQQGMRYAFLTFVLLTEHQEWKVQEGMRRSSGS